MSNINPNHYETDPGSSSYSDRPLPSTPSSFQAKSFHLVSRLKHIPGIGILFGTFSGILFAFSTAMVKVLNNINPFEILFFRSIVQIFIYLVIILFKRDNILSVKGERLWIVAVNFVGFIFLGLTYFAVSLISLGDSSAIIFSSSVYASIFARFILKEPCSPINLICIIMVISGVLLISRPSFLFGTTVYSYSTFDRTLGLSLSLVASLSAALTYVMMRKLRKTATSVTMFWFSFTDCVLALVVVSIQGELTMPTTANEWMLLIGNGLLGTAALILLGLALKLEDAGPVSLARTTDIVVAFIIQITILHDPALWTSVLGSIIIVSGVCISAMRHLIMDKVRALRKASSLQRSTQSIDNIPTTIQSTTQSTTKRQLVPTISITQH